MSLTNTLSKISYINHAEYSVCIDHFQEEENRLYLGDNLDVQSLDSNISVNTN
jgi:hypothetical protein